MRKLVALALAILAIAALVFPPAAQSNYAAGQKLVCITFDDGWQNQYVNAVPNLQGFKATFAVVTDWVQTDVGDCMSWTELHTLANNGMDIASHTMTHDNWETLNATTMQNEVTGSKTALEQAGFTVRTFVYPFYYYTDNIVTAVKNAGYICARSGALNHPYTPGTRTDDDQYKIDAIDINNQDLNTFKGIVDQATDHSVICLNYHSVSDDPNAPTPVTPVANFAQQMQYLKDNNFAVVLLPDLVQDPWISCSPVSMAFSGMQGGSNPATQTLSITNTGGGSTLNWTASSSAAWLTLSASSGTAPSSVTVTASVTGLSAGAYNGTITVNATGATNTPQAVPVTLIVQTPSSSWLAGWSYRKQIAVAGTSAGAQTDYPMKLTINRSSGTDSGANVYLGTRCAGDYKDIRFTKFDGTTLLDYWIESSTTNTATVWVEIDSVPASPGTANFNLYYGNSGATSASNIKNTFTFADDFEGTSLDAARWTTGGDTGGTATEANGVLTVTAVSAQKYAASIGTYNNSYALHTRARLDSITGCSSFRLIGFVTTQGSYLANLFTTAYRSYDSETNFVAISGNGSSSTQANMNVPVDTSFRVSECRRYAVSGTNYDSFIIDENPAISGANPTATARYIYINSGEPGKAIIVDWIILRKYVSVEPAWAAWGNEETAASPAKAITAFNFNALTPPVIGVVTEATHTIALSVPFGTSVTALVPTITHTGASINPASGAPNNFTTPQTYTVAAADASTQDYIVTVTVAPNPAKAITAFNFNALTPPVIGVVTEATHTIALSVPFGTSVTALVPTITHTGASINPASGAPNNFTTPQTYTIAAADASTQDYIVTVSVAPNTAKAITAFNFNALTPPVTGVVTEATHTIALSVPYGTAVTALVPTITHTGASVNPASGASNNFTTPQTYTVTAADTSTQAYTVTVTVLSQPPTIGFSPSSLTFSGVQGGTNPATQSLSITNSGGGTLNWTTSSSAAWLTLAPTSSSAPSTITVTANTTGLTANIYNGTITITSAGATNTPQTVPVTLTVTPSGGTIQKLIGADDAAASAAASQNYLVMDRFTAVAAGTLSEIRVKCTASSNIKAAIYSDASGSPGTLLIANNTGTTVTAGWNTVSITGGPSVVAGTNYWIAVNSSAQCIGYSTYSGGTMLFRALPYAGDFPSSAGTGFTTAAGYHCFTAGWGLQPPVIPVSPAVTNASGATGVTATSATLNGNLTSTGNADCTIIIYWGATDGNTTPANWANNTTPVVQSAPGSFSSPITGLTTGSTYYYRCFAQNSAGTSWATSSSSFVAQTPPVLVKLLGMDDASIEATATQNYIVLDRYVATAGATVSEIRLKCSASGNVKVAMYSDNAGSPNTLLAANNAGQAVSAGWNTIPLSGGPAVTSGNSYWIAANSSSPCIGYRQYSGGTMLYRALPYAGDFPASAGTGFTNASGYHCMTAGWGASTPPVPPSPPTLSAPGSSITFQWGASTGATKYWLQVNTTQLFTGTDIINADIGNITLREVTGFSLGTTYYWRVRAGNDSGWSTWSSTRSLIAH